MTMKRREVEHDKPTIYFVVLCAMFFGVWYMNSPSKGKVELEPAPETFYQRKINMTPKSQNDFQNTAEELFKHTGPISGVIGILAQKDAKAQRERSIADSMKHLCASRTVDEWIGMARLVNEDGLVSIEVINGNFLKYFVAGMIDKAHPMYKALGQSTSYAPMYVQFSGEIIHDDKLCKAVREGLPKDDQRIRFTLLKEFT